MDFPLVEMLPRTASWAVHLPKEEEEEMRTPVYQFSGNSVVKLPDSFLPPGTLAGEATFTLFFWFRYNYKGRPRVTEVLFKRNSAVRGEGGVENPFQMECGSSSVNINHY